MFDRFSCTCKTYMRHECPHFVHQNGDMCPACAAGSCDENDISAVQRMKDEQAERKAKMQERRKNKKSSKSRAIIGLQIQTTYQTHPAAYDYSSWNQDPSQSYPPFHSQSQFQPQSEFDTQSQSQFQSEFDTQSQSQFQSQFQSQCQPESSFQTQAQTTDQYNTLNFGQQEVPFLSSSSNYMAPMETNDQMTNDQMTNNQMTNSHDFNAAYNQVHPNSVQPLIQDQAFQYQQTDTDLYQYQDSSNQFAQPYMQMQNQPELDLSTTMAQPNLELYPNTSDQFQNYEEYPKY